jgi:HD-GYP domain-containing protein (c-di-GMP phosphodiesterase class II)
MRLRALDISASFPGIRFVFLQAKEKGCAQCAQKRYCLPSLNNGRPMKTVAVGDLKIGMFVGELDRPWEGTPFLLQGVLITGDDDIAQLASLCKTVKVDPRHSVGDVCNDLPDDEDASTATPASAPPPPENETLSFVEVVRRIKNRSITPPSFPPNVDSQTQRSDLAAEIIYSAQFFDAIQQGLQQIPGCLKSGQPPDLIPLTQHVHSLADSAKRNPDALLWLSRLKATGNYDDDHALDVSIYLMIFGHFLELPQEDVVRLGVAGLLQDIGKIQLSFELQGKTANLGAEELRVLQQKHVKRSFGILSRQPTQDRTLLEIVAKHHERIDGSGYPRRLAGENVGLFAEMAGLIDTYCAIIRKRSYAETRSAQKAVSSLVALRGSKFQATLVDPFIQCIGIYPIGALVELNTGEVALVLRTNPAHRLQPQVLIILNADKSPERYPRDLDLAVNPLIPTGEEAYRIVKALPEDAYGVDAQNLFLA